MVVEAEARDLHGSGLVMVVWPHLLLCGGHAQLPVVYYFALHVTRW